METDDEPAAIHIARATSPSSLPKEIGSKQIEDWFDLRVKGPLFG